MRVKIGAYARTSENPRRAEKNVKMIKSILDIKAEIKRQFIREIELKIHTSKYVLGQKDWANTGSDYHKECRLREKLEIEYFERLLKKIK